MDTTKIYICHHDDDDGIMSGSILKRHYTSIKNNHDRTNYHDISDIICVELNYEIMLSDILGKVTKNDIVTFVDYSFAPNATENIKFLKHLTHDIACTVIWVDHHDSSVKTIEMSENSWMKDIPGAISTKYCGAMLIYWWLEGPDMFEPTTTILERGKKLSETVDKYYENTPIVLKYVDDYDCFKRKFKSVLLFHTGFNLSYDSKDFIENAETYLYSPKAIGCAGDILLNSIIDTGTTVEPFNQKRNKNEMKNAFECKIPGFEQYTVLACNSSNFSSVLFGSKVNDYDIVCVFRFIGDKFRYSVYTAKSNIKVNEIAEHFGGGGHPGAAGFHAKDFIFSKK